MSFTRFLALLLLSSCVAVGYPTAAAEPRSADIRDLKLFRFEFDNDTFVGSDDGFSAGWSIQVHSPLHDEWKPGLAGWIGRLPTLGDDGDGGRIVRSSWGVTQLIITPADVTIPAAQPNDAPWAGLLGGYASWSAYDDRRLAALQFYVGCIGPCSQAEDVQGFVHDDLGFGEIPRGWANQLEDELLFNVNYEYRRKLWASAARGASRRWGADLALGTQAGLGSFATYAATWLEYRFGWDLPRGFTKLADPPAIGIALDPVHLEPNRPPIARRTWRPYFNVVARVRSVEKFAALEDRATQNGGWYHPAASTPGDEQVIVGMHIARLPLAFHLTYYRYLDAPDVAGLVDSELDWVNISFERRF
jgi:lipid A 3-O-deacylase